MISAGTSYPSIGVIYPNNDGYRRLARDLPLIVDSLRNGNINTAFELTLTAGTQTIVNHPLLGPRSVLLFTPLSAAAAALQVWISARAPKSVTLGHSAASGSEPFALVALG